MVTSERPRTVGDLRRAVAEGLPRHASVKDEIRANLLRQLRDRRPLFPGIIGYDDTVVPQLVNACCRGTTSSCSACAARPRAACCARSSICSTSRSRSCPAARSTTTRSRRCAPPAARASRAEGDALPIAWLRARRRATSRSWRRPTSRSPTWSATSIRSRRRRPACKLADELTMHYGLLPRANRGIFAINELPDLAGKIQVGLFNILQEGDVQIKGYPDPAAARRAAGLHAPTPRTTRRAARSSRRSRTASARRSARTTRRRASKRWRSRAQEAWTDRAGRR